MLERERERQSSGNTTIGFYCRDWKPFIYESNIVHWVLAQVMIREGAKTTGSVLAQKKLDVFRGSRNRHI